MQTFSVTLNDMYRGFQVCVARLVISKAVHKCTLQICIDML